MDRIERKIENSRRDRLKVVTGGQDSSLGELACDIFKFLWDPVQQSPARGDFIQHLLLGQWTYDPPNRGNGTA